MNQMPKLPNSQTVPLTPREQEEWGISKALLLAAQPGLAHIFYELLTFGDRQALFTLDVPIAATDGRVLILNPRTFFLLDPGERLFVMGHEIVHTACYHPFLMWEFNRLGTIAYPDSTKLPYIHALGNVAADYTVNAILVEGHIGKYNSNWYYDPRVATSRDSFVEIYRKLYNSLPKLILETLREAPGEALALPGSPIKGKSFDEHHAPGSAEGKHSGEACSEVSEPRVRRVVKAAMELARQQGSLPQGLERVLGEVLEPKVDWTERLMTAVTRRFGNDRWSYEEPNQEWLMREIYVPGRSSYGAADIVVGGDTSGSISDEEVAMMGAEMVGIFEQLRPRRIIVVWCDAKVQRVETLESPGDLATMQGPKGGGGTSFVPVFDWIGSQTDLELDGLIYMTDGIGAFPRAAPSYPVIWASVLPLGHVHYPFGDVVEVPRKGTPRGRTYARP